jgi:hypothetical protein
VALKLGNKPEVRKLECTRRVVGRDERRQTEEIVRMIRHMGAREVSPVRINGRDGQLVRAEEMWFLQARLPDGSVFNLQAPLVLTRDQVIAIGEQVTVRR